MNNERPLPVSSLAKLPRQRRSVVMVHDLIDAAIVVLQREGTTAFTTNRVAEVAGVSPGSLYQYFANRDMLIAAVVERGILETETLMRMSAESVEGADSRTLLSTVIVAILTDLRPYARLLQEVLLMTPYAAHAGVIPMLETRVADLIREWLTGHPDRYVPRHGAVSLVNGTRVAVHLVLRHLTDPRHKASDDAFVASVVEMIAAGFDRRG
jgi:AcrR family transcriptional regulator